MIAFGLCIGLLMVAAPLAVHSDDCPLPHTEVNHNEAKLHKDLLCAYDSTYRPVKDHKDTVTVKVRFALKYMSFDSLEETFTVHSWVALTWKDELLTWDPANYDSIKELQVESSSMWTPQMSLFNADASMYQSDTLYTTCLLESNGTVTCVPHLTHSGICRTSLSKWPYDYQNCTMFFGSWMHTGEQVNFTFFNLSPIVLDDYQDGPGWKLLNVVHKRLSNKFSNNTYPMLKYTFVLRREAAGPAAIVVVPSIIIVLLTLTALLLDINDNTRLMLACFSLFGHFMFITEIGYDIPKHSADTPIILLFIRDSMIISLMGILLTLLLMSLKRRVLPPPTWIVSMNRLINSGPGKYVVFTEFDPSDITDRKALADDANDEERSNQNKGKDWVQFTNTINSITFIICLLIYIILICTYIPRK